MITIKRFGNLKFSIGLENIHYLFQNSEKMSSEPHFRRLPRTGNLKVWDIGSNIGFFTVFAASLGHQVTAFDLSPRACRFLRKNLKQNNLTATVIERPLTIDPYYYSVPITSHQENKLKPGRWHSLTWAGAILQYGVPDIIKMDIEGGEDDFLCNKSFSSYVLKNAITLFVECHKEDYSYTLLEKDSLHSNHLVLEGNFID